MLTIKTGMVLEADVVRKYADKDTLLLTGYHDSTDLELIVPQNCTGIINVGFCGGLSPLPRVGNVLIAEVLVTPDDFYAPDEAWSSRLAAKTNGQRVIWMSTGKWGTADTPKQRAALHDAYDADCIDDESAEVALFAERRNVPFTVMRVVSDDWHDDVSMTRGLIDQNGEVDWDRVDQAFKHHPKMMKTLGRYFTSAQDALAKACQQVGPHFQCRGLG